MDQVLSNIKLTNNELKSCPVSLCRPTAGVTMSSMFSQSTGALHG